MVLRLGLLFSLISISWFPPLFCSQIYRHGVQRRQGAFHDEVFNPMGNRVSKIRRLQLENQTEYSQNYPWIAHITSAPNQYYRDAKTLCVAACIRERIFIASARCVLGITVGVNRIVYADKAFITKAIVVPDDGQRTRQSFDDIGFVVVESTFTTETDWVTVRLFDASNRTDDSYQWFAHLDLEKGPKEHEIVTLTEVGVVTGPPPEDAGGIYKSGKYKEKSWAKRRPTVIKLDVVVGIEFCQKIYNRDKDVPRYYYPCAYPCTYEQFLEKKRKCRDFIQLQGSLIVNKVNKKLIGIGTWGYLPNGKVSKEDMPLPVGFSVPNSEPFWENYRCAIVLSDETLKHQNRRGHFQNKCDEAEKLYLQSVRL